MWHLDVYRLSGPQELLDLGWDELLEGGGVVLLEWPERVLETLPGERLDIHLEYSSGDTRQVTLTPHGERARTLLGRLREGAPSSC